jgi:hypothetical protein
MGTNHHSPKNSPQNSNDKIDEKGLLQPESNHHTIYVMPPDATPEERHAIKTLSRVNDQLEQPVHRAKPAGRKPAPGPKHKRRSRRKLRRVAKSTQPPDLVHESRCSVCQHQFRAALEEEFIHWHSPRNIAYDYDVSERAVYRHAHALNLFAARDRNLRFALGNVIDRVDRVPVMTPDAIIKAIHAYARINGEGQWVEPPRYLVISQGPRVPSSADPAGMNGLAQSSPASGPSAAELLPHAQLPPAAGAQSAQPALAAHNTPAPKEETVLVHRAWTEPTYMLIPSSPESPNPRPR